MARQVTPVQVREARAAACWGQTHAPRVARSRVGRTESSQVSAEQPPPPPARAATMAVRTCWHGLSRFTTRCWEPLMSAPAEENEHPRSTDEIYVPDVGRITLSPSTCSAQIRHPSDAPNKPTCNQLSRLTVRGRVRQTASAGRSRLGGTPRHGHKRHSLLRPPALS